MSDRVHIEPAHEAPLLDAARALFVEYAEAIEIDLCFQSFDAELSGLPGAYAPPDGRMYVGFVDGEVAGCVALRPKGEGRMEMKRLYVRPSARGTGLGRALAERVISDARELGAREVVLDTLESRMPTAVAMYRAMGFDEVEPYTPNPHPDVLYLALAL